MAWNLSQEQLETVFVEVKAKVQKENYQQINSYSKWQTGDIESYLLERALKDSEKFNEGTKGDNYLRYLRQVIKMDYLDFLRKHLKDNQYYAGDVFGEGEDGTLYEIYGEEDTGFETFISEELNSYILKNFGLTDRQKFIYQKHFVEGFKQKEVSVLLYGNEAEKTFLLTCKDPKVIQEFNKSHKGYKTSTINREVDTLKNKLVDNMEVINTFI
jgi:hypothetical protein